MEDKISSRFIEQACRKSWHQRSIHWKWYFSSLGCRGFQKEIKKRQWKPIWYGVWLRRTGQWRKSCKPRQRQTISEQILDTSQPGSCFYPRAYSVIAYPCTFKSLLSSQHTTECKEVLLSLIDELMNGCVWHSSLAYIESFTGCHVLRKITMHRERPKFSTFSMPYHPFNH